MPTEAGRGDLRAEASEGFAPTNIPPEKQPLGRISLNNITSGAGEQFQLPLCRAKDFMKGVFLFTDTGRLGEDCEDACGHGPNKNR